MNSAEVYTGDMLQSVLHNYSAQRGGNGGPALNALATIMLVLSLVVAGLGFLGYRWLSRGERIDRKAALATIAGA